MHSPAGNSSSMSLLSVTKWCTHEPVLHVHDMCLPWHARGQRTVALISRRLEAEALAKALPPTSTVTDEEMAFMD